MPRPIPNFHGFIGQRRTVEFLRKQIRGALAHGQAFGHLLLHGASGMGKTKLARALAQEYGTDCKTVHGKKASPREICAKIVTMKKGDFLFIDEAQGLTRDSQELLFQVIDGDRVTDWLGNTDAGTETINRDENGKLLIAPLTIVLATDQPGMLLDALQKRMVYREGLAEYSLRELREIVSEAATKIGVLVTSQSVSLLAKVSQGQPRRAEQILKKIKLHFADRQNDQLTVDDCRSFLKAAGINKTWLVWKSHPWGRWRVCSAMIPLTSNVRLNLVSSRIVWCVSAKPAGS
jgi:Holliday junction DNA helicase RuvB